MTFILDTPQEIMKDMATKAKKLRLEQNLTQEGLAVRSGVSLGSIKRFERSGEISLKSLLELALVLGRLSDFENVFALLKMESLFNQKEVKSRRRGRIK